ncbi:MAG: methyltransferase family protein [Ignavibacteriaceae bacterium]
MKKTLTIGKIFFTFIYILIYPTLLLLLSGDWLWTEGWIFSIWFIALSFTTIIYLYRNNPELLVERYKKPGTANQKGWDKYVVLGLVLGFFIWIIIMSLDVKRYEWTKYFPLWLKVIGVIELLLSSFLFFSSFKDNSFLSPLVRIQSERKQKVASKGVYSFVRHPMYLGAVLLFIGTPMLLGSLYGLIIGFGLIILLAGRIIGEEKMLLNELDGYGEYKKKVQYRLIPFIW